MADSAIVVEGLVVTRGGTEVLHGLDLDVPSGRIVGLLGPSGCGKSTLMRAIVGVQIVRAGRVAVLGEPAGSPLLRSRIGYVTQSPSVYADLSVRENLAYFARIVGAASTRVEAVLEQVELTGFANRPVARLSGGQRARVSLAAAMIGEPDLLVLDEPTVGLDPVLRVELWSRFRVLADAGVTLLVSSHVMDEAERCDALVLMREGTVLATGTVDELLARTGARDVEGAFLALVASGAAA
jgi:ABC-2 type transport system ATP-binding protein